MRTDGKTPSQARGRLAYLALVPVLAIAALLTYGAVRLALPAKPTTSGGGTLRSSSEEVAEAARLALQRNEFSRAEALLREGVRTYPAEQTLRLMYGEALLAVKKPVEALEQYEAAIGIGPDHAEYRHVAASIADDLGMLEEAEFHWTIAQKLAPAHAKFPLYLAQVQRKLNKPDAARASAVIAATIDPELDEAWATLAMISLDENNLNMALQHVAKARALNADSVFYRVLEARALRRDNQPQRALDLLMGISEPVRLGDAGVLTEISLCLGMLGRPGDAAAMYEQAARRAESVAGPMYEAAVWHERAGQREAALRCAQAAAAAGNERARALVERLSGGIGAESAAAPTEERGGI